MNEIANNNSWKVYPIDNPHLIKISLVLTEEEFLKLKDGHIPTEMEDKWFIFYKDGWLYFHRSWTGFGMYKAQILPNQPGYFIEEFWVERNKEKNSSEDDQEDSWEFVMLVGQGLLDINTRLFIQEQNQRQNKIILQNF